MISREYEWDVSAKCKGEKIKQSKEIRCVRVDGSRVEF